jgi:hypothetical protein
MLEPFTADCLSILPEVRHGFFTRQGGVSSGLYRSLNCGAGSNDDRVSVIENRSRVAQHLGSSHGDVVTLYQVHSAEALIIDRPMAREELPQADSLVTKRRGLAIGVLTADCAPILFADPRAKVVAAAHAGWRGALSGVLEATIQKMLELGASKRDIRAAVGPCISQAAYQVGPEFEAEFIKQNNNLSRFFIRKPGQPRPYFDLPGFAQARLKSLDLAAIEMTAHCTYGNESLFYSYRRSQHRREPDYGRQISAIVVA